MAPGRNRVLLATRGRPVVELTSQSTALDGPMRAHSQKPEEFYELVETLCPAPPLRRAAPTHQPPGHGDEVANAEQQTPREVADRLAGDVERLCVTLFPAGRKSGNEFEVADGKSFVDAPHDR